MVDVTRRTVLGTGLAGGVAMAAAGRIAGPRTPAASRGRRAAAGGAQGEPYFFKDPTFEFNFLIALGGAYYQAGTPASCSGDQADQGRRQRGRLPGAEGGGRRGGHRRAAAGKGHRESARQAYLWAQTFYDAPAMSSTARPIRRGRRRAGTCSTTPGSRGSRRPTRRVEQVAIPYEGTTLRGFYFRGRARGDAPAADLQQRQRRLAARHAGRWAAPARSRAATTAHLRRPRPGLCALEAEPLLPPGLGEGDHAGRRLRADPAASTRSGSRSSASARAATGCRGPWPSRSASPPPSPTPASSTSRPLARVPAGDDGAAEVRRKAAFDGTWPRSCRRR